MTSVRFQKVKKLLQQEKADALLVVNHESGGQPATNWLSGFTGTSSVLLITKNTPPHSSLFRRRTDPPLGEKRGGGRRFLITDGRYTAQARKQAKGYKVSTLTQHDPTRKILKDIVIEERLKTFLIDGTVTPFSAVQDIQAEIPELVIRSKKRVLQELRMVKEKDEIALLTKAASIASRAFLRLLPEIRVGVSEKALAFRLEMLAREGGADEMAFPTIVASGLNAALPHARASEKKLAKGEFVLFDWGVRYQGYVSDMTRTIAIGKLSPKLAKMYAAVQEAQRLGCEKAKAGMTGRALHMICHDVLDKRGFGKYFSYAVGHGIGMEVHELPIAAPRFDMPLPAGSVITCEPGIHIPNVGGVRIEDALVLTKNGNVNLTKGVTKELIVI